MSARTAKTPQRGRSATGATVGCSCLVRFFLWRGIRSIRHLGAYDCVSLNWHRRGGGGSSIPTAMLLRTILSQPSFELLRGCGLAIAAGNVNTLLGRRNGVVGTIHAAIDLH